MGKLMTIHAWVNSHYISLFGHHTYRVYVITKIKVGKDI